MPKVKLEKVTGVVALSYLVLIPVAGAAVYLKLKKIDHDVDTMWDTLKIPDDEAAPTMDLSSSLKNFLRR